MRLFIAVPLPPAAEREASRALERLRAVGWPVRWVRDGGLHITLKFFGEVTPDRADAIAEMLEFAAINMAPLGMALAGGGALPAWERPRVLHLEVRAGPDLELLQDRLERGGERLGFPPEGRPFRPHITLGRVREGHRLPEGWREELERIGGGEPFLADRVVLFESELSGGGPVYTVRHEVRLA
jgi:2'-5' RNA ligase